MKIFLYDGEFRNEPMDKEQDIEQPEVNHVN